MADGIYEGQELELSSYSGVNSVQIVNGTNANIATGAVILSGVADATHYRGIKLNWYDGRWREVTRARAGA